MLALGTKLAASVSDAMAPLPVDADAAVAPAVAADPDVPFLSACTGAARGVGVRATDFPDALDCGGFVAAGLAVSAGAACDPAVVAASGAWSGATGSFAGDDADVRAGGTAVGRGAVGATGPSFCGSEPVLADDGAGPSEAAVVPACSGEAARCGASPVGPFGAVSLGGCRATGADAGGAGDAAVGAGAVCSSCAGAPADGAAAALGAVADSLEVADSAGIATAAAGSGASVDAVGPLEDVEAGSVVAADASVVGLAEAGVAGAVSASGAERVVAAAPCDEASEVGWVESDWFAATVAGEYVSDVSVAVGAAAGGVAAGSVASGESAAAALGEGASVTDAAPGGADAGCGGEAASVVWPEDAGGAGVVAVLAPCDVEAEVGCVEVAWFVATMDGEYVSGVLLAGAAVAGVVVAGVADAGVLLAGAVAAGALVVAGAVVVGVVAAGAVVEVELVELEPLADWLGGLLVVERGGVDPPITEIKDTIAPIDFAMEAFSHGLFWISTEFVTHSSHRARVPGGAVREQALVPGRRLPCRDKPH